MSKKTDRIYVGSGVEVSVNLTKLGKDASSFMFEYNNEKFIKLKVSKNRDGANEYGKTHFVEVNTYQPEAKKVVAQAEDDLPF